MGNGSPMVRKSYFVDPKMMERATKLLGVKSEAEALRKLVSEFVTQERFWKFLDKTTGKLKKKSFKL